MPQSYSKAALSSTNLASRDKVESPVSHNSQGASALKEVIGFSSPSVTPVPTGAPSPNSITPPTPRGGNSVSMVNNDSDEPTDQELAVHLLPKASTKDYKPLEFDDALDMLMFFNENIRLGATVLYPWQAEDLIFLSSRAYTASNPLDYNLRAVNGSGKDAYVIAPLAVFKIACSIRSRVVITSSSFKQLDKQTESYIRNYCFNVNKQLGFKFFIIKRGHIVCPATGSEIVLFVTDEEGNVEGFHPFPDYPNAEMLVIVNEAKSVSEATFTAMERWTGYNIWLNVSSAGLMMGTFFRNVSRAVSYPKPYVHGQLYTRCITAYDCPHIAKSTIQRKKETLDPNVFANIYLGEFLSNGDECVIPQDALIAARRQPPLHYGLSDMAGGLDLSLGGDATVLVTRKGNAIHAMDEWKMSNAVALAQAISQKLKDRGYVKDKTPIYADIGGLGQPIASMLTFIHGWNIIPILNNRKARNSKMFCHGGTEDWFNFKELVMKKELVWKVSSNILDQELTTRLFFRDDNGVVHLQSKPDAKAKGNHSPDHADALVLAFIGFQPKDIADARAADGGKEVEYRRISQDDLVKVLDDRKFNTYDLQLKDMLKVDRRQRTLIDDEIDLYNENLRSN